MVLLLGALSVATVSADPIGWQPVGAPGFSANSVFDTKLALDTSGTPYVAFREAAALPYRATVMRYNGTAWEVVGTPGFSAGGLQDPSLALDAAGTPYLAYRDMAYGQKVTVMRYDGSAGTWQPVGAPGFSAGVAYMPSLALDAAGAPYVAYADDASGGKATVMRYNGTEWQPVGAPGFSAGLVGPPSLALAAGAPYIAYRDLASDGKATVMRYNGSAWEPVGTPGFSTSNAVDPSLALDSVGTPYVAYQDYANGYKATVMRYNGTAWELVGQPGFTWGEAHYVNLALDPAGVPYVAYADYSYSMRANVMRYNGSAWEAVGTPYFSASFAYDVSLALDADGAPYVAYVDSAGGQRATVMRYVGSVNEAPNADPGGPYLGAVNTSIAFDGSLSSDPENDPLTYAWTFGDAATGTGAAPRHSYTAVGVYNVCLTVNDGSLDSVPACTLTVVYDPSAGFVTGGGWINSPAGAYKADETLAGKATFGFISKYQKGASVPTGNTAFQFDLAGMAFASQSYDWLVVNQAGTNAQFKGTGMINGAADPNGNAYRFMLWAGDGSPDTFRIRIWWEDVLGVETVLYDNGTAQAIDAGNIVVHTGK